MAFLTGLGLTGRSSQRGQVGCLGNLFLVFFFGLLHSSVAKFSSFCSLFLVFLSMLSLQSNRPTFVLQNRFSNKMLNLGCFGSRFLTFLFRGFLRAYWQTSSSLEKLESLWILLAPLGPRPWGIAVSVSPEIPFSPFQWWSNWGHSDWNPQYNPV